MKTIFKLPLFVFVFLINIIFFGSYSYALDDNIITEPLFSDDQIYYQPYKSEEVEDKKVKALDNNDAESMYILGMMYKDGKNVEPDYVQALEWFKKSAQFGNSNAMIETAKIYSMDPDFTGVDQNQEEAIKYINEAEKRNNPKAYYTKAIMYEGGFPFEKSNEKAFSYYKKAANKNILNAYVKMYLAYQYGKGVDPNVKMAIYWLRKIEKEAPDGKVKDYAKKMLSDIYFELALKEDDDVLKFKLFNLSWANGNKYAIEAIGDMLQAGRGVKQSYSSAIVAYETAIKNYESIYGMERLGYIYLKGPAEIDKDYSKAYSLFKKAADLGGVTAAYMLGYMNLYGLGIPRNTREANIWYNRSQQLAQTKRDVTQSSPELTQSTTEIKNIIQKVDEKERQRQQIINQKIQQRKDNNLGEDLNLPDVPKY